ncbi:hypothetical protein DFS34DRAFT_644431 [Phlyctochytrium arcticum]|nr:hypothetical protein DFS34DRAFT_644431 [Phlyctochytrium arcticum]
MRTLSRISSRSQSNQLRSICVYQRLTPNTRLQTRTNLGIRTYTTSLRTQVSPYSTSTSSDAASAMDSAEGSPSPTSRILGVSDNAASQLHKINKKANTNKMLRVAVDSGGCHGFQYKMELTDEVEEDDIIFENQGAKVVVDPVSLDMVGGSVLDYVEQLIGASFQIVDNPRAETSCGCKTSFNIKM